MRCGMPAAQYLWRPDISKSSMRCGMHESARKTAKRLSKSSMRCGIKCHGVDFGKRAF